MGEFLSTPSARRATQIWANRPFLKKFLSTPSARRATLRNSEDSRSRQHFYPRPPRGGRLQLTNGKRAAIPISIHALREEGDLQKQGYKRRMVISIHALREEGDDICCPRKGGKENFYPRPPRGGRREHSLLKGARHHISIHALREEGDEMCQTRALDGRQFLSTPSARRATSSSQSSLWILPNFYPRPPRGGRREHSLLKGARHHISIHALREEGDEMCQTRALDGRQFLSTPSARRATSSSQSSLWILPNFYPRPPRGGRQTIDKVE